MGYTKKFSNLVSCLAISLFLSPLPSHANAIETSQIRSPQGVSAVFLADDTYERICLVLGWIDCAEWRILDETGVEKNRVIGPYPESALRQVCGSNLCGGGLGGRVELIKMIPKEILPVTDYGPGPRTSEPPSSSSSSDETTTDSSSDDKSEPAPRLGGYAVVHPETRHVCGVIVATIPQTMTSEYMGCPSGSKTYFQTRPSETGNVAGYHGKDVTFYDGVFYLSWGSIADGIATDRSGRVWDTGTGRILCEGTAPPSNTGGNSQSNSVSPGLTGATSSETISASVQTSSPVASGTSSESPQTQSVEITSTTSETASSNRLGSQSGESSFISGKTIVGSFLGRWAVRFENLYGSTVSIRAGGNWHKFTLSSDNQLFSRRSIPGTDVRLQIWVDGISFTESSVIVR